MAGMTMNAFLSVTSTSPQEEDPEEEHPEQGAGDHQQQLD
jgi:hypothetical protein